MTDAINDAKKFIGVPELRERGWTEALIRGHLGPPDARRVNPEHHSAAPIRLYLQERALAVERSAAWAGLMEKSARRKAAAATATQTKRDGLRDYVDGLTIEVPAMSLQEATAQACESYNLRQRELDPDGVRSGLGERRDATVHSDPLFLQRITVNYLRHCLSQYDDELARVIGKVGVTDAYAELNRKVYAAIATSYPGFREECERQAARKSGAT